MTKEQLLNHYRNLYQVVKRDKDEIERLVKAFNELPLEHKKNIILYFKQNLSFSHKSPILLFFNRCILFIFWQKILLVIL